MGKTKRPMGTCHICGKTALLSFEHVPPQKAFNNKPVIGVGLDGNLWLGPGKPPAGRIDNKGAGQYTLCEPCNNNTGSWYGAHFVEWCYSGMDILRNAKGKSVSKAYHKIRPLAIIKQIIVMLFSTTGLGLHKKHPELVEFVLDRENSNLPSKYQIYVYLNMEGCLRSTGFMALINLNSGSMKPMSLSEISFPPFGYLLSIDSASPHSGLQNITWFSKFKYNDTRLLPLELPILPTHLGIVGDYRTKEEILEQVEKANRASQEEGEAETQ